MLKKILSLATIIGSTTLSTPALCADTGLPPELQGLGLYEGLLPIGADNPQSQASKPNKKQSIIPFIQTSLPKSTVKTATKNITDAEQVFCYHVSKKPKDYEGYTLNNFAITDYCGELDIGTTATTYEALFTQSPNIITAPSPCSIEPQIMLRFTRGVDYTDVLLSSPCPSFTIFYAGRYTSFNIKQGVIDDIISQFDKNHDEFNSPALLKKTVANGVAQTDKEAEEYEKQQKENAPIMNWKTEDKTDATSSDASEAPKAPTTGWGRIKLRM